MARFPNDVRIVFKHNALPFHPRALPAAKAAQAAHLQGKFWAMHDKLFENIKALSDYDLARYAAQIGLNVRRWKADIKRQSLAAAIAKDMQLAERVSARGTPNFYINGRNLRGAVPFEDFEDLIEEELVKARQTCAGIPGARCYANRIIAHGKVFQPLDGKVNRFQDKGSPYMGAANAKIVVTVFADIQCPYSSRLLTALKQLVKDRDLRGRVKVVFKHFPLNFHKHARSAARAAIAAHAQNMFWPYVDLLYANMKQLNDRNYVSWARQLGLSLRRFKQHLNSGNGDNVIERDMNEARVAGLRGTPTVYINGRKYQGAGGYSVSAFKSVFKRYFLR